MASQSPEFAFTDTAGPIMVHLFRNMYTTSVRVNNDDEDYIIVIESKNVYFSTFPLRFSQSIILFFRTNAFFTCRIMMPRGIKYRYKEEESASINVYGALPKLYDYVFEKLITIGSIKSVYCV